MVENMYFVYSLVIEGQVFYIGKCKNLAARYAAHISQAKRGGYNDLAITAKLREILNAGKCPLIKAIAYLPLTEALKKERHLIQAFYMAGQAIANSNLIRMYGYTLEKFDFPHTFHNVRKNARYQQRTTEYDFLRERRELTKENGQYPPKPKYKR